jgi:hypothetical protein
MTLLELATRCEQATGPDKSIDREIAMATGWQHRSGGVWERVLEWERPAFTASLDAAMTLVPDSCLAMVKQLWDGDSKSALARVSRYVASSRFWMGDWSGLSDVPALALCAAALRARAAIVDRNGEAAETENTGSARKGESAVPQSGNRPTDAALWDARETLALEMTRKDAHNGNAA